MENFQKGDIVSHDFRKSGLYAVIEVRGNRYIATRVKKQAGYPLAGTKSNLIMEARHMHKVARSTKYEGMEKDKIFEEKRDKYNNSRGNQNIQELSDSEVVEKLKAMDVETSDKFRELVSNLSPENLSCDGELSRSAVNARYRKLMGQWVKAEREVGFKVTENVVWDWIFWERENDPESAERAWERSRDRSRNSLEAILGKAS